ncbi:MAG: hypothetical protein ACRCWB_03885 [Enterovibrio sp.]
MTINRHQGYDGSNQRLEPEHARNQSLITQKICLTKIRSASLSSLNLATNHAELCSGGDEVDAVPFSPTLAPSAPSAGDMGKMSAAEKDVYNPLSMQTLLDVLGEDVLGDDGYHHKQDACQSEQGKSRSNSPEASSLQEKLCHDSDGEASACGSRVSSSLSQAKNKWPDHILQAYPRIVEYLSESDSGNTIIMAYSDDEYAMSESPAPSDYADEVEEDRLYVVSSDEVRSSKMGKDASRKSTIDNGGRKQRKTKRRSAGSDKKAGKGHHNPRYASDSTDDGARHKHRKCTSKKKHLNTQKAQPPSPTLSSTDSSSCGGSDDQTRLVPPSKNKLSFAKKETVKLKGSGKVKYSKLENCTSSSSSCSSGSDSGESDADSNAVSTSSNASPSWKKKAIVFLGGIAVGAGGVIATMRGGGAAAAAVGGLIGLSFATNSESKIEGSDNTVVGGGSNGLFSYNYIWKPPQPGLIRSLHETNREECMRMGMVYKDPTDDSWYGWNTPHDGPSCLMNVPPEMIQGFCRTLLVKEPKEGEQSNQDQDKKTPVKRDTDNTKKMLDRMRGEDANDEDSQKGKEWLKKSKRR